jgi:hypothetical protein
MVGGDSVSLSGDGNTLITGDPNIINNPGGLGDNIGAAWVFTRSGGVWSQQQKMTVNASFGYFGFSVSLAADGSSALGGAPRDKGSEGTVWTLTPSGGVWAPQQTPLPINFNEGAL